MVKIWVFILLLLCSNIEIKAQEKDFVVKSYGDTIGFKNHSKQPSDEIKELTTLAGQYILFSPKQALEYYTQALDLIKKLQIKEEEAGVYNFMGRVYEQQGIFDLAMEYYFKSLSLYDNISDTNAVTWAYTDIGNVYYVQQNYKAALEYYEKALSIFQKGSDQYGIATALNNIALVNEDLNQRDTALALFNQALKIRLDIGDPGLIAHSYTYIGRIYDFRGNYKLALDYYQQSFDLYTQADDKNGMASMLRYISKLEAKTRNQSQSYNDLTQALSLYKEAGNNFGVTETLGELADMHLLAGQFKEALYNAQKMRDVAIENGILSLQHEAYLRLSQLYEKQGKLSAAFENHKNYVLIRDSLRNKEVAETISRQQFMYEREKQKQEYRAKEIEIEKLERTEDINRMKTGALFLGLVLLAIIGTLVYSRQHNIHLKDREIILKNQEIQKTQLALVDIQNKEKESLNNELKNKQSELSNFALHIIQKNDLLQDIKARLRQLHNCDEVRGREKLNEILVSLAQDKRLSHDIKQFQSRVDQQNEVFFKNMLTQFPDLTQNDKRIIALLRLHLTTKEIASLNNISEKAVEMSRYRLRKKLNMEPQANIIEFLQNL